MSDARKIGDLQVFRAIAILLVLAQHLSLAPNVLSHFPNFRTMPFWAGVELFFVISGYVVSRSIFSGSLNPLSFFLRRLFRLWPAILLFIAVSAVVFALHVTLPSDS